tara:strand:- start:1683 stop:2915 length:1233 start_codon:yes stop_codon:yes gene_type:complete
MMEDDFNKVSQDEIDVVSDETKIAKEVAGLMKQTVSIDLEINKIVTIVEASSGKTIVEITGVAFHEGRNKNKWEISRNAANFIAEQMINADVTLNHPDPDDIGFGRNMEGGVDKAVVGIITKASVEDKEDEKWVVNYTAQIHRPELFEALESGLWLRSDYGVSIGGFGIPTTANEDGMTFDDDFTFDHLAIVHRPAYNRASIDTAERVEIPDIEVEEPEVSASFKYHSLSDTIQQEVVAMTDEQIEDTKAIEENGALASEIESLKADIILRNAEIETFKAAQEAKAEEARQELVEQATDIGLKGHEELSTDVISSLIASWKEANPETAPVVMEAAVSTPTEESTSVEATDNQPVVANFLNGVLVESKEDIYGRCWNAWARAWNDQLTTDERRDDAMRAKYYEEIKTEGGQ